jgi:outer membrane protein assembly factor BamB
MIVTIILLLVAFTNLLYSSEDSIQELWRKNMYNYGLSEDTSKSDVFFTNHILVKDINYDGKPEIIVATERFLQLSSDKGKILALDGIKGNTLWQQSFDCGLVGLSCVSQESTHTLVAIGDSVEGYLLSARDGKVSKKMTTTGSKQINPLSVSPSGDLTIITGWGDSLQMINSSTLQKRWQAKSETNNSTSEKRGFISFVLVDMNNDKVEDVVLVDCWALKLLVLNGNDGRQIWKTNLAKKEYKSDLKRKLSGDFVFAAALVVDIDGNGQKEVVLGTSGGALSIFSGKDGLKIFHSQLSHENPMKKEIPGLFKVLLPKLPEGAIILQLASADLNKDGFLDIIATCVDQKVYALDGKSRKLCGK